MKKLPLILSTLFILILSACGGNASNSAGPASAPQGVPSAGTLPVTTQLIVGTLKLDGTAQAVTAEQAQKLLPLWQTLQVLSESDTAATEEKEALIAQIQETMTAEQTQAIQDMNLTRADMQSIMQGMALGGSQNSASQNANSSGGRNFGPGAGGPPDEVRVDGGGGGFSGGGQNISADQIATAQAARQANQNSTSPMLINAVIEYLQEKAES